jgi:hypothetical protein
MHKIIRTSVLHLWKNPRQMLHTCAEDEKHINGVITGEVCHHLASIGKLWQEMQHPWFPRWWTQSSCKQMCDSK